MFAALALALLPAIPQDSLPAAPAAVPAPPAALRSIAVAGASLSAGAGLNRETGRRTDFADVLEAVLVPPLGRVVERTSIFAFLDPETHSTKAVDELLAAEPTLFLGVDFLFWFAYGNRTNVDAHLARFEKGLALLDRIPCTIVVGDVPDMTAATKVERPMLHAGQVPPPEALAAMNARLAEWAAERTRVVVLPLADFARRMNAGERLEVRGNAWEDDAWDRMMQPDRLHPSLEGAVAVALIALDRLLAADLGLTEEMVRWDVAAVLEDLRPRAAEKAAGDAR